MSSHIQLSKWLTGLTISIFIIMGTTFSMPGAAAAAEAKKTESADSEKLDVQKLEQKYWSAKDDDFTVVQNRAFTKEKRWYLNLGYALSINDPFSAGPITGLNVGYYFSDRWGLELGFRRANFHDNDSTVTYRDTNGVSPDTDRYQGSKMINLAWVPLYGKMSWLDKKILYFDMGMQLGLGQTDYSILRSSGDQNRSAASYSLNLMQHFFFSEHWALRVDFTNIWTNEDRKRFTDPDRDLSSKTTNDTSLMFGITYWK